MARLRLVTIGECAENSRLHSQTWRNWIREGRVPVVRLGRRVFIEEREFEALVEAGRVPKKP